MNMKYNNFNNRIRHQEVWIRKQHEFMDFGVKTLTLALLNETVDVGREKELSSLL